MNITKFKDKIKVKDAGGNRTHLSVKASFCKYGQSYQNSVHTLEDMKNRFVLFYYPLYQKDLVANKRYCSWCGDELSPNDDLVCGYHHLEG